MRSQRTQGSRTPIHAQIAFRDPAAAPLRPYPQTPSLKLLARKRCQCSGSEIKQKYAASNHTNSKLSEEPPFTAIAQNARSSDNGFSPRPPERNEYLSSYRGSNDFDAPSGNGNALFNLTARVDAKPKLVQRQPQPSLSFAIGIVDPNSHHTRRAQNDAQASRAWFSMF
jgi:hypothetical protein